MQGYLEPLKRLGVIKRSSIDDRALARVPFGKLLDALSDVASTTVGNPVDADPLKLSHCASIPLAGGRTECANLPCRIRRADELARFAALYSDQVYFHNDIADSSPDFGHEPAEDSDKFRWMIADDLAVQLHFLPLINAGLMVPFATPTAYCMQCLAKDAAGKTGERRVLAAQRELATRLLDDIEISVYKENDTYFLECDTDREIFGSHGGVFFNGGPPESLSKRPSLLRRVERGEVLEASRALRTDLGIHKSRAQEIIYNAIYLLSAARRAGTAILTHRTIDTEAMIALTRKGKSESGDHVAPHYMHAIVPIAGRVPVGDLIELRDRKQGEFVRFRAALRRAAAELSEKEGAIPQDIARELYNDVVAPELARLDQAVKEGKKDLRKLPAGAAASLAATMTIGSVAGLMAAQYKAIWLALGIRTAVEGGMRAWTLLDGKRAIRQENFYYLWKVRHMAERRGAHEYEVPS